MDRHMLRALAVVFVLCGVNSRLQADEAPLVEKYLIDGKLAEGETTLKKVLADHPDDDRTRYGLGSLQMVRAVERLSQSLYRYGFGTQYRDMIGTAVPGVFHNPKPEAIGYIEMQGMVATFVEDLGRAEATLAGVKSTDVKLPLHFGQFHVDVNNDGKVTEDESFWRIYEALTGQRLGRAAVQDFVICFDGSDVAWMRGYCHLLMGMGESWLAYDSHEWFERTGHLLFPRVKTPYTFLADGKKVFEYSHIDIVDLIAYIHLLNFPVKEPQRMKAALGHYETTLALSRKTWDLILAETDDDHEWIPSPKQRGIIPGIRVTPEIVQGWLTFVDEAEALLAGKKLIPFWRANDKRGINIRKVFTEPTTFDVVMWLQGTAALPYLEDGEITSQDTWNRLQAVFRGQFIGYAAWFN
jgi:hypothetical protein